MLGALRDESTIPRRRLETVERRAAVTVMRAYTPIRHLISRHTRELLRRYFKEGMITTPIADRKVRDEFIEMTAVESGNSMTLSKTTSRRPTTKRRHERAICGRVRDDDLPPPTREQLCGAPVDA